MSFQWRAFGIVAVLICLSSPVARASIFFSSEIKTLLNPCTQLLSAPPDTSEASAEAVRRQLSDPSVLNQLPSLPRHGVGVVLLDSQGRVLLSQRKGSHGAGEWAVPGGKLEEGETVFETARREVYEEAGVEIEDVRFVGVTLDHFPGQSGLFYSYHLTARIKSGTPRVLEPEKAGSDWQWFGLDRLPSPIFLPMRKLIELGFGK